MRGDPYYKLFAGGGIFQVASHRTATLAKVYGEKCMKIEIAELELFAAKWRHSGCHRENPGQNLRWDVVAIQKVLKPLGLAITLKIRPINHTPQYF